MFWPHSQPNFRLMGAVCRPCLRAWL